MQVEILNIYSKSLEPNSIEPHKEYNIGCIEKSIFGCTCCKVEFNQPSCWLYSVPNLLVFQQLVTLYLGGLVVRVVSEIKC